MIALLHPNLSGLKGGLALPSRMSRTIAMLGVVGGVIAGCTLVPEDLILTRAEIEERALFHPVPAAQAWINAPGIRAAIQRDLRTGAEQQLSLANETVIKGDNLLVLRTRGRVELQARFRFEEFVTRLGGTLPYPFEQLEPGSLIEASDELGNYFWAEERLGQDTLCVLGLRRLDSSMRQMPLNATIMDIMLRHCVNGGLEAALAPLLAANLSVVPFAADLNGESRMLSPLAGPTADARRMVE